jgi:hypothetical protein
MRKWTTNEIIEENQMKKKNVQNLQKQEKVYKSLTQPDARYH